MQSRWLAIVVLSTPLVHVRASADEPPPAADDAPPAARPSRPIGESADRLVRKLDDDRKAPCGKATEGVPCFPVSIERSGPEWTISVRDSLDDLGPSGKTSPNRPPTKEEMRAFRPGSAGLVIPFATFDPGCVGKSALKRLKGKNDTYYLYRVRDVQGERVALYAHRLEAATFQGSLEFLGRFEGECKALSAYKHEERKTSPRSLP
jgi:hypothetical protein